MSDEVLARIRRAGPLLVLSVIVLLGAYSGLSADSENEQKLPFDPLDPDEQQRAVDVALADPEIQGVLDRFETIGAALNTDKHRLKTDPTSRMADVWFYDYTSDQTILALVDLVEETPVSWKEVDYQPPLTAREATHAETLALEHAEVTAALDERGDHQQVQVISRLWSEPAPHPCAEHRCVLVGFILDGEYRDELGAVVDLSADLALGLRIPAMEGDPEVLA